MKDIGVRGLIRSELARDIGNGDITCSLLLSKKEKVRAEIIAQERGVISGIKVASLIFKTLDPSLIFRSGLKDGEKVKKGKVIAEISGRANSILMAERTALNFLSHLSGVSSLTSKFLLKVKNYKVRIMDTRKTIPGLRSLEKKAVKDGGGENHRFGLFDGILIKDNHITVKSQIPHSRLSPVATSVANLRSRHPKSQNRIRAIEELVKRAKEKAPKGMKVEIEVENFDEAKAAADSKADVILLDNMDYKEIKRVKDFCHGLRKRPLLEVSGGVNLDNVRKFAKLGVDRISIGSLTHSAPFLNLSLEIK